MRDRLLTIIQSDTPDVAAVKAILAENQSAENPEALRLTLVGNACDQYQVDMRNTARKEIIFLFLDYLKNSEHAEYASEVFSCYERFYELSRRYNIAVYESAAILFMDRLCTDRLSASHLEKSANGLMFNLHKFSKLGLLSNFERRIICNNEQAINAFKIDEQGKSSIIGFMARHHYFAEKQQGKLRELFGHYVTTWSDFIRVLSMFGLDTRSEFILYNQGEHPIGIARFLREKLNQPEVFLAVMQSPEAELIVSKQDRQANLSGVLNVDEFVKRAENLLKASKWESVSPAEANKMKAALDKEKQLVQACLESGAIAASQLTLPFLAAATQVMRVAGVAKNEVREERYECNYNESEVFRPRKFILIRDKYELTFGENQVFAEVGEGLLAKLGKDEKSWTVFPVGESPMLAFVRYLTPEQAERLVNEFASGQCESRLGYAMGRMFEEVDEGKWYHFQLAHEKQAYQCCVSLFAKCDQILSGFIERLPITIKVQFSFDDYVALLRKTDMAGLALANELRLVFPRRRQTLLEMQAYFNLLFSLQLSLDEIVKALEVLMIRKWFDDIYGDNKAIENLLRMVAKNFNLSIYEVCQCLTDGAKKSISTDEFLQILKNSNAELPLSNIARLLTEKQRDKLKNVMIAGLREVDDIAAFIDNKGDFVSYVSSIIKEDEKRLSLFGGRGQTSAEQQRYLKLSALRRMLNVLPSFRDWRALGVDLGWSHEGNTVLDAGARVQWQPYRQSKFYFMNASLQAHYRALPLSLLAEWKVILTALTGLSQHVFNTPGDEVLGLNSFEQSLVFWMTKKGNRRGVLGQVGWGCSSKDADGNQMVPWKKMGYVYEAVKSAVKKSKISNESAWNQEALNTTAFMRDGYKQFWDADEVARLVSFWMFETKVVSKSSKGLVGPIQAAFLVLLTRYESLRVALREQMVLGGDCILLTILKGNEQNDTLSQETKSYAEARALLREMSLSDGCVNELARRIESKECTVRDVVLYLGLTPSLTDEQFSVIVNDFLNKSIDAKEGSEHAQIQDALLCLSEKEAEALKARLSISMVNSGDSFRKSMSVLFAAPKTEADKNLIWHIIHAGKTTATIKDTHNAKHVKECLDHPEYSVHKIYGLFKLPPPAGAILDPARAKEGKESLAGGVADRLIVNNARREHEEAVERNFPI